MNIFGYTLAGIASAIVSFLGFLIGMRVAKERADRALLRELYQELFVHFRSIRDAAKSGRPKDWNDFPLSGNQYMPMVRGLSLNGRINLLPTSLASLMTSIETDSIQAGRNFKNTIVKTVSPTLKNLIEKAVSKPAEHLQARSYAPFRVGQVMLGEKLPNGLLTSEGKEVGIALEFALERSRTDQLYIFGEKLLSGTVAELLSKIEEAVAGDADTQQQAKALKKIIIRLDTILDKISARIKDPNPFWETMVETLSDIFRR